MEDNQYEPYVYLLQEDNAEQIGNTVLNYLNNKDPKLMEIRLEKSMTKNTNDILQELRVFISTTSESSKEDMQETAEIVKDIQKSFQKEAFVKIKNNLSFQLRQPINSFTGRDKELKEIDDILGKESNILVVSGIGGVGKSELVRKFAHMNKKVFDYVVWINSETNKEIVQSFKKLATELKIPLKHEETERDIMCVIEDVYKYLGMKKCLLILDNVTCRKDINKYLPTEININVLITTQNSKWGNIAALNLNVLSSAEAVQFIRNMLTSYDIFDQDEEEMNKLAAVLQYLPLALQQALAYIVDQNDNDSGKIFTIAHYLELLNIEESLLDMQYPENSGNPFPDFSDNDYSSTVFLTLRLILSKVAKEGHIGKLAIDTLNVIAYIFPDYISKSIILESLPDKNEDNLKALIEVLAKYSVISVQNDYIHIHRLVQRVLRVEQKKQGQDVGYLNSAMHLITSDAIPIRSTHGSLVLNHAEKHDNLVNFFYKNQDDTAKKKLFLMLCFNGCIESVKKILDESETISIIHSEDEFQNTPLHLSCLQGHENITKLLIDKGADVNRANIDGFLPVHKACFRGHLNILKLLSNRTDFNAESNKGLTPLLQAVAGGHTNIFRLLLNRKANPLHKTESGFSALHLASAGGYVEIIKLLIDNGVKVNETSDEGITPLHEATFAGHNEVIQLLVDLGANLDAKTSDGYTPIYGAVAGGHTEILKTLLRNKVDANVKSKEGALPLHVAAQAGLYDICKILVYHNEVNALTDKGLTPLYFAVLSGHVNTVKLLLENGAKLVDIPEDGLSVLHRAVEKGNLEIVKLLITNGGNIHCKSQTNELSLLHLAAAGNYMDIVDLLIQNGAQIDVTTNDGSTPLHKAVIKGHTKVAKHLIVNGACVHAENNAGMTVLVAAASGGYVDLTGVILDSKADPNHVTKLGITALWAAAMKGYIKVIQLLHCRGANLNQKCKGGVSVLHLAAFQGHLETVAFLLDNGADIHGTNDEGFTPLSQACLGEHVEVFNLILFYGADIACKDNLGRTLLHMASSKGNIEIASLILENGVDVNVKCSSGKTALMIASFKGPVDLVNLLLSYGAFVNEEDCQGYTALHAAAGCGQMEIIKLLLDNGADVNAKSTHGIDPVIIAAQTNHLDAAVLLMQHKTRTEQLNSEDNNHELTES